MMLLFKASRYFCIAVVFIIGGCAQQKPSLYYWGSYESLVHDMYLKPGQAESHIQIEKLTEDLERIQAEGKRVPPGLHAHLGYMYFLQGNEPAALQEFATERDLFPESATFIDSIIKRAKGNHK